jgi:4'-phosphopantetheinyl transferase
MQYPGVEIVVARLDVDQETAQALAGSLSGEERQRACRFRFARHRRRYIVARGLLRQLLASRLGTHSRSIELSYGAHGKPRLAPGSAAVDLRFNLSHCADFALFAFCRGREVGVDVEALEPLRDADAIARQFFSRGEFQSYRALAPRDRERGFFRRWTRKEACLKALGASLHPALNEFEVPPGLSLRSFSPAPGHAAALAVESGADARA